MVNRRKILHWLGAGVAVSACIGAMPAAAQAFPSKPIKFIVPFGPGSGTDTTARYFGQQLQELTGQTVIVENKPGANGTIAIRQVLDAPADGYTVFIGSNSTLAVNVALFKQLPYDPLTDLAPLTMMFRAPAMLVVPGNSKVADVKGLIADAKANPDKLSFGAGSAGYQLMGELFNVSAGIKTLYVPFKSAGETVTAVASDVVNFAFAEVTSVQELVKGGRLKALAVASDQRVATAPDVPTFTQAGLPGFEAYTWVGGMVNSKTPAAETAKLAELLTAITKMPETKAFYDRIGATVMTGGPAQMRTFQKDEITLWKDIVTKAGVPQQ